MIGIALHNSYALSLFDKRRFRDIRLKLRNCPKPAFFTRIVCQKSTDAKRISTWPVVTGVPLHHHTCNQGDNTPSRHSRNAAAS